MSPADMTDSLKSELPLNLLLHMYIASNMLSSLYRQFVLAIKKSNDENLSLLIKYKKH